MLPVYYKLVPGVDGVAVVGGTANKQKFIHIIFTGKHARLYVVDDYTPENI